MLRCAVAAFRLLLKELEYGESHSACVQQGVTPRGRPYQTPFATRNRLIPEYARMDRFLVANGDVSLLQQGFGAGLFPLDKNFAPGYSLVGCSISSIIQLSQVGCMICDHPDH